MIFACDCDIHSQSISFSMFFFFSAMLKLFGFHLCVPYSQLMCYHSLMSSLIHYDCITFCFPLTDGLRYTLVQPLL
jgi:hypothetical protein